MVISGKHRANGNKSNISPMMMPFTLISDRNVQKKILTLV